MASVTSQPMNSKTVVQLRQIAKERNLKGYSRLKKDELLRLLDGKEPIIHDTLKDIIPVSNTRPVRPKLPKTYSEEFLALKKTGPSEYVRITQIGKSGKEGTVYMVTDTNLNRYAMKTFRKQKSGNTLEKEAYFQYLASLTGISPKIIEYNPEEKYIVMEMLNRTLFDIIKEQEGKLTENQQRQIINLYRRLDDTGVAINDANPLNIMEKDGTFYLIDYGFAKFIDHKDFRDYTYPNYQIMPLGLLLWMKDRYNTQGWTYIRKQIAPEIATRMKISEWP